MPLFNLFGKSETVEEKEKRDKEMLKQWQRNMKKEMRGMDRQIRKIQMEEEKVKREIKQYAKKGEMGAVKTLVKSVVRSKKAVDRLYTAKAQMNSVTMELQSQAATMKLADTMKMSAGIMRGMNKLVNLKETRETMKSMAREMSKAGLINEMMEDAFEDMEDDIEDDAEKEVAAVLQELAIEGLEGVTAANTGGIPQKQAVKQPAAAPAEANPEEDELLARLGAL